MVRNMSRASYYAVSDFQPELLAKSRVTKMSATAGSAFRTGGTHVVYSSIAHLRSKLCLSMALSCSFRKLPSGSLPGLAQIFCAHGQRTTPGEPKQGSVTCFLSGVDSQRKSKEWISGA